jgi:hypothetical protein
MGPVFEELFGGGNRPSSASAGAHHTSLSLSEQITQLQAMAERTANPCRFKVGDLVTVRHGMDVRGMGKPHVVIEVFSEPVVDRSSEPGSNRYLNRYTMRVAHFCGSDMTTHAVGHEVFEPWTEAHAKAWDAFQQETKARQAHRLNSDVPLSEVVRLLREEGRRLLDAKIVWKRGELVEILGYETSNAAPPMLFGGRAVGLVETIDHSDDTTRVIYFDDVGRRRAQWFRPVDLKPYCVVEPVMG